MKAIGAIVLLSLGAGLVLRSKGHPEAPTECVDQDQLVAEISVGETIRLADHVEPDTWTLFEFGADW